MAGTLELATAKLLGPGAAVVVLATAVVAGQGGLEVGAAEIGGAAIALFVLREVFGFIRWFQGRNAPTSTPASAAVPEDLKSHMRATVRALEAIQANCQSCVLGNVDARERFFAALERSLDHAVQQAVQKAVAESLRQRAPGSR